MTTRDQSNQVQKHDFTNDINGLTGSNTNLNDTELYILDLELARARSKLKVLFHAATCPCEELSDCTVGVAHCCASKRLFAHIITCMAGYECEVPGCQHSRRVWRHYRNCKHNIVTATSGVSSNTDCVICSAVPVPHDVRILCDRFRTKTRMPSRYAKKQTVSARNIVAHENESVDSHCTECTVEYHNPVQFDRLPVWRKRNLMHAQQQELQGDKPPSHEKENSTLPNGFTSSRIEKNIGGEIRKSTFGNSHESLPFTSRRATADNYRLKIEDEKGCSDFPGRVGFCPPSSTQLPAHPRDAKRRPSDGPKPIALTS